MSLPRIAAQIVLLGGQIVGKAFVEAWRQAGRNMRAGESAMGGSASVGVGANDNVSRRYKMTIDEACNILNVKRDIAKGNDDEALQQLLQNYERMMKSNEKTSHYLQSKIVRARERVEAELPQMGGGGGKASEQAAEQAPSSTTTPPPS